MKLNEVYVGKLHRKIDIFVKVDVQGELFWEYMSSTNQSSTCREAKEKFCERTGISPESVKASFAK